MGRHGTTPPGGNVPIRQSQPSRLAGTTRIIAGVLLREAIVGLPLWTGAAEVAKVRLALHLAAPSAMFPWTRKFGSMHSMIWKLTLMESRLLYLWGIYFSNLWLGPMGVAHNIMRVRARYMREQP